MKNKLKLQNISKSYGDLKAVNNLSLEIEAGTIFAFLGPNGAGKTTCLTILSGLLTKDGGTVSYKNKDVNTALGEWKKRIGLCPQETILYSSLSCMDQLIYTASLYGISRKEGSRKAEQLLKDLGLFEKRKAYAGKLSGGMKRRLNLALSLIHDPEIIILDEPEAGLDPQSRLLVREFIKGLIPEKTVIYTTHNMDEAERLADKVGIIDRGVLLCTGGVKDLILKHSPEQTIEVRSDNNVHLLAALKKQGSQAVENDQEIILSGVSNKELFKTIFSVCEDLGIFIKNLSIRNGNLEDVFLNLTGRGLR